MTRRTEPFTAQRGKQGRIWIPVFLGLLLIAALTGYLLTL